MLIPPEMLTVTEDVLAANQGLYRSVNSVVLRVASCWQPRVLVLCAVVLVLCVVVLVCVLLFGHFI